ncbi:hypothetical protein PLICRDRAFT_384197 [Plicaturopsis crispa FD-325 SS-3]|nr:hypothetical protein PLICRDRAFT_384197 [Plicaturopsis crispa FD-325 SS-3]
MSYDFIDKHNHFQCCPLYVAMSTPPPPPPPPPGVGNAHILFPNSNAQVFSSLVQFTGLVIATHCLSRRIQTAEFDSWSTFWKLPWVRLCSLALLLDIWLFLFIGAVLAFGVGMDSNAMSCSLAIYSCLIFYGSSKLLTYLFLLEKIHVVWSPPSGMRRRKSPVYIICSVVLAMYSVFIVLGFIGRKSELQDNGPCIIGFTPVASISILSYDTFVNILMTSLFVWPLFNTTSFSPILRGISMRTLVAAAVALGSSSANLLVLVMMHSEERGWMCIGTCGLDVICNLIAVFWASSSSNCRNLSNSIGYASAAHLGAPSCSIPGEEACTSNANPTLVTDMAYRPPPLRHNPPFTLQQPPIKDPSLAKLHPCAQDPTDASVLSFQESFYTDERPRKVSNAESCDSDEFQSESSSRRPSVSGLLTALRSMSNNISTIPKRVEVMVTTSQCQAADDEMPPINVVRRAQLSRAQSYGGALLGSPTRLSPTI